MNAGRLVGLTFVVGFGLGFMPGVAYPQPAAETRISVNCAKDIGRLEHFWAMTGFDHVQLGFDRADAQWVLDSDQRQQIMYIGSIPHGGIRYVRTHNLLYLVKVEGAQTENPRYDWSKLDQVLDLFVGNGLKPFFEMMGVPQGIQTVEEEKHLSITPEGWRRLSRDLALHLIDRYGRSEVRTWFFEVWNEPDNWDLQTLCNYYDACSEGLKAADPQLRWGGPGTWNTLFDLFKGLLAHCDTGTNYFTGATGTRMDFISVHEKGIKRSAYHDGGPDIKEWVDRQIATLEYIRGNHPRFANTLFVNNECDPKGGWWNLYSWRAGPYFPAIICKYISHHLRRITGPMGAETIISYDNAFIGQWEKRSHVARFGDPGKFELIKKPVNAGMVLLSLLGDRRCMLHQPGLFSNVGAIATTRGGEQVAVLIYNCNEAATREKHDDAKWVLEAYGTAAIQLRLQGLPFKEAMLVHYRIDNQHTNPHGLWKEMGSPEMPSADQFAELRTNQELAMLEEPGRVQAQEGRLALDFELPMPGVSLVLLSAKPPAGPGRVTGLRAEKSPGLMGAYEVMLVWKGVDSRTIRTYEVLFGASPGGPFHRVNGSDLVCTAFLHVKDQAGTRGHYKVRAVDYWGRPGEESQVISYPPLH